MAIFFGQTLGVVDVSDTCIIGSECQFDTFLFTCRWKRAAETSQAFNSCANVLLGVAHLFISEAEGTRGGRHDAHQPLSACPGDCVGSKMRFKIGYGSQQAPIPAETFGVTLEKIVVRRNHSRPHFGHFRFRLLDGVGRFCIGLDSLRAALGEFEIALFCRPIGVVARCTGRPKIDGHPKQRTITPYSPRGTLAETDCQTDI